MRTLERERERERGMGGGHSAFLSDRQLLLSESFTIVMINLNGKTTLKTTIKRTVQSTTTQVLPPGPSTCHA